ncbi:MAG: DUF2170 family protein [Candidatus Thiodiazotropha sp.]|jgi:uncharacterized protein
MTWTLTQLQELVSKHNNLAVTQEDGTLVITNEDGIEAYLTVSGEQILIETLLFPADQVKDISNLNADLLRTHMVFPLTSAGITTISGEDYYTAFGALSAQSKEESIFIEIDTLFQNVNDMLDAYASHLH